MKAEKYLQELIEQEQDYLAGYDDGEEKPKNHIKRLKDLKEALTEVKNCSIPIVSVLLPNKEEVCKQAAIFEDFKGWEGDISAAEKDGKRKGFVKGAEWMRDKINKR
jgi:hypothetical protein